MANLGNVTVAGNLTGDPKRITTAEGKTFLAFTVAENKRVRDRESNEWRDGETTYWDTTVNSQQLGENVESSLSKGDRVVVQGLAKTEPYVTKDGRAGENYRVRASEVAASLRHAAVSIEPDAEPERAPHVQATGAGVEQEQRVEVVAPSDVSGWEPRLQPASTQAPPVENFGRGVQDANAQAWAAAQQSRMTAPQHQAGGPGIS
ncbi:MAG: single-stranded DNA-binding protein [Micrococcaceae bacterium]